MFRDFQAGLLVSADFTSFQAIFRLDLSWSIFLLNDDICFLTFSKVLQIYLVSHQSNMQLICALVVVNGLNQLNGIVEAVLIRNGIYHKKCVCPANVLGDLRCITLKLQRTDYQLKLAWRGGEAIVKCFITRAVLSNVTGYRIIMGGKI